MHVFRNGQDFDNPVDVVSKLRDHAGVHEHDFTTVIKTEKETLFVCSNCSSAYCARCGRLLNSRKSGMHNISRAH